MRTKLIIMMLVVSSCSVYRAGKPVSIRPQTASILDMFAAVYATGGAIVASELVNNQPTVVRASIFGLSTAVAAAFWTSYILGERVRPTRTKNNSLNNR